MLPGVVENRLAEALETTQWQLKQAALLAQNSLSTNDPQVIATVAQVLATNYLVVTERKIGK
ncbi:hypothetical protein ATN89_22830 [Comamonas thiooxydans]|nr:hypothetical protein ATN89_22830 [Comamonas thiooxydans]